ncbi:hypothetical protein GCM10007342_09610 [Staphylococcus pragensis]|nr:hypothetical protein GCM10007342_09610 [Staphylococcus pragensis]
MYRFLLYHNNASNLYNRRGFFIYLEIEKTNSTPKRHFYINSDIIFDMIVDE